MSHAGRLPGTAFLASALLSTLGACGHRGDPLPPLRHTPPQLQEFRLAQRGDALEVSVRAPVASVDGIAYESLIVELLFAQGEKNLEKAGERREVLALPRQRIAVTLPLPAPGTIVRAAARGVVGREKGPRTLTMALIAHSEVTPARELVARLAEDGVELAWSGELPKPVAAAVLPPRVPGAPVRVPPVQAVAVPDEERSAGFLVYRRVGAATYAGPLARAPLEALEATDTSAPQGVTVCYVVRAAASLEPLLESAASNEACLEVRDIAAPGVPSGLAVLPRERGLELIWTPSPEDDLASYRVYREAPGEPPGRVAEVVASRSAWIDEKAKPGVTYLYTLSAVDRSGNESGATPAVEASLP